MTTINKEQYHEIFIPFADTYIQGGPEVFKFLSRTQGPEKNLVVIPYAYIEQLDDLAQRNSTGAIDALRTINGITNPRKSKKANNDKTTIYHISEGLDVAISREREFAKENFSMENLEKRIAQFAESKNKKIILISGKDKEHIRYKDGSATIEQPKFLQVDDTIVHEGVIDGTQQLLSELYQTNRSLTVERVNEILGKSEEQPLFMNQCIRFNEDKTELFAIVKGDLKYNNTRSRIVKNTNMHVELLKDDEYHKKLRIGKHELKNEGILGITPRDMEQYITLQHFLVPQDKSLVFVTGTAGSGKTLLAYAWAMDSLLWYDADIRQLRGLDPKKKGGFYKQAILIKPIDILGGERRNTGFLPGDLYEKLEPHLRPYINAHEETILNNIAFEEIFKNPKYETRNWPKRSIDLTNKKIGEHAHLPADNKLVDLVHTGFMRGASIRDSIIIVDEGQNLTPYEMKTIFQRVGENCKVVVLGDPRQIDNPECSTKVNGLTAAIKHYLPKSYSALIHLNTNYRHQISEDADDMHANNS